MKVEQKSKRLSDSGGVLYMIVEEQEKYEVIAVERGYGEIVWDEKV